MGANEQWGRGQARRFRGEHGLGTAPVKDVFEMVHLTSGVDAFSIEATGDEHGLTMFDPDTDRHVIVVATTPHPMRQRSSVAHELSHVIRGDLRAEVSWTPGDRSPAEVCADAFARHLLLPLDAVRHRLATANEVTPADLSDLVQEYLVSPALAAIQLRGAGLITAEVCTEWSRLSSRQLAVRFGWAGQYDDVASSARRPRAPQGLMQRAVTAYQEGILGVAELASWYGQSAESLWAELGEPQETGSLEDGWGLDVPLFPAGEGDAPA